MTTWWQKLPSLTPVKGFARFLYVITHWETISEDLKRRDERLQAVEDADRQLLRLQHETHKAVIARIVSHELDVAEKTIALYRSVKAASETLTMTRDRIHKVLEQQRAPLQSANTKGGRER
jgi:hypothetical protein